MKKRFQNPVALGLGPGTRQRLPEPESRNPNPALDLSSQAHDRVAVEEHAVPELQVQEAPNLIAMVRMPRPMFGEQAPQGILPEQSTVQAAGLEQRSLNHVKLRSPEPTAPGCGKAHLPPI